MKHKDTGSPPTWVSLKQLDKKNSPDNDYITDIDERLEGKNKPLLEEPCMAHPFQTSIVKIRNNGMIDIFVSNNQGIRVDPGQKTVSIITNGLKEDLGYFHAWVHDFSHWFTGNEIWHLVEKGNYRVDAKMQIEQVTESYLYQEAIKSIGIVAGTELNAQSLGMMNLGSFTGIDVNSTNGVNISAGVNPRWKNFAGDTVYKSSATNSKLREQTVDDHTINRPPNRPMVPSSMNLTATKNIDATARESMHMSARQSMHMDARQGMSMSSGRNIDVTSNGGFNVDAGIAKYNGIEFGTIEDDAEVLRESKEYTNDLIDQTNQRIDDLMDSMKD